MLALIGCSGPPTGPSADAGTGDHEGSGPTTSAEPSASTSSTAVADDTAGTTVEEPPVVFIAEPDLGVGSDCNIFAQDCPPGLRCTPVLPEGWRCMPLSDDPVGIGETCHTETPGIDDCPLGAMCWNVDPETSQGTCLPLCVGEGDDPWNATCEDPELVCISDADSILAVCEPTCHPLAQDCVEGYACIFDLVWRCAPTAGEFMGYGGPCEFVNVCQIGLACVDSDAAPPGLPCEGSTGCCMPFCDLLDPRGDAQCPGVAEGEQCLPWYEPGQALAGYEDVGVCAVPPL